MYLLLGPVKVSPLKPGFQATWLSNDGRNITTPVPPEWEEWILTHLSPSQLSGTQGAWVPLSIFWECKEWQNAVRLEFEEYGVEGNFEKLAEVIEFIQTH